MFIHLRLHTEYSLSDGIIRIEELVERAVELNMPAIAITDQVNLFAAVKFYQACESAGLKPILGCDCLLENTKVSPTPLRFTLLCQNLEGYRNLTRLISRAYLEGQSSGLPLINFAWLENNVAGLIALSGGREGDVGQALLAEKTNVAEELLSQWQQLFPERYYLEIQRTGRPQEEEYLRAAIDLAEKFNIPVVATNDARFINADEFEAHEARVCISSSHVLADPKRPRVYSEQQYLRSSQEMAALFADLPAALENSVEIAKRCNLEIALGKSYLPDFPIPAGFTTESYLIEEARQGLAKREANQQLLTDKYDYAQRLQIELDVINAMGFAGYFLIVADFIRWSKENGIPVGPGRGSGAGSLVAYALQITDLDPLPYDLLFERFLNPERVSMPDFDIDFCMDGRDRVIEYVTERYGREAVSQIITYGSMAARGVVRDVGRVLGHPYGMMDKLAKLIPFEIGITLEKALAQEEELQQRYQQEDEVKVLFDLARKLEGLARNVGKHAAGVVIAPSRLTDFTPLYCEADSRDLVSQFDMDDIQAVGLVKFDFLGLRTLTIIDWCVQSINKKSQQQPIDITKIPIDDVTTYNLLKACATTAVFQLESRGMKDLVKRLKPDCFEDIIALVALFRPGPLGSGMVDDFINRKHGHAPVTYLHASLEPILRPTYGIIVYQEQVMQIAQVLAGYTLGAADLLRRAMGKKKPEEMAKQREIFTAGAEQNNVSPNIATAIFDLMEKFADYGFNKSHSAAYALVAYQTAWLKAYYPAEFMAAVLSSDMDNTDKVVFLLDECRMMKLTVLPPDINRSQYKFTVDENGAIVYGLGAIKGAGEAAIEIILAQRDKSLFKDLFDLCKRIDSRKVNRRVLEALIRSGSLDCFGHHRSTLQKSLEIALQSADQDATASQRKQHDLFGGTQEQHAPQLIVMPEWSDAERLQGEKISLGFYLSGHPLQRYETELANLVTGKLAFLHPERNKSVLVAGWVVGIKLLQTKRGDRMAIVTLEDNSGRLDITVFSEAYASFKDMINKDQVVLVEGEVTIDEFSGSYRIMARKILNIIKAREQFAKQIILKINSTIDANMLINLQPILLPYCKGNCPVAIEYHQADSLVELRLGNSWSVTPADELLDQLQSLLGSDSVDVRY